MTQTVHLNGGPLHDQHYAIPDDRDHIHIMEPITAAVQRALLEQKPEEGIQSLPLREGMYSQVRGRPGEFEWDGWHSHD